jgi:hypothetical protein
VWIAVLRFHLALSVPVAESDDTPGGSLEPWSPRQWVGLTSP